MIKFTFAFAFEQLCFTKFAFAEWEFFLASSHP